MSSRRDHLKVCLVIPIFKQLPLKPFFMWQKIQLQQEGAMLLLSGNHWDGTWRSSFPSLICLLFEFGSQFLLSVSTKIWAMDHLKIYKESNLENLILPFVAVGGGGTLLIYSHFKPFQSSNAAESFWLKPSKPDGICSCSLFMLPCFQAKRGTWQAVFLLCVH